MTVPRTEEAVAAEWEERWQSLKERYRTNAAELLAFLHQLSEESRRIEEEAGRLEENAIQKLAAGQNHLELVKKEKRVLEEKSRLEAFGREMEARRREAAAAYESRKPELEDQIRRMQDALPLYAEQEKKRQTYETLEHQRTALTQNLKKMQNQLETCRTQEEILRNQEREAVEARAALAECRGRREQMERRQAVLQELGTVSYTHLDVYKRQAGELSPSDTIYGEIPAGCSELFNGILPYYTEQFGYMPVQNETCLVIADADGSHPREISDITNTSSVLFAKDAFFALLRDGNGNTQCYRYEVSDPEKRTLLYETAENISLVQYQDGYLYLMENQASQTSTGEFLFKRIAADAEADAAANAAEAQNALFTVEEEPGMTNDFSMYGNFYVTGNQAYCQQFKDYGVYLGEKTLDDAAGGEATLLEPVLFQSPLRELEMCIRDRWNGKQYRFAMNGQSGKFVGDLPVDQKAAKTWTIGLSAMFAIAAYGVSWLLWLARII